MQDTIQSRYNHHEEIRVHDRGIPREDERILATIPSGTGVERYAADGPSPETYRQALKAILATPEIESRLNYITASLIVSIFGGWLAGKMIRTRAFTFFTDIVLFLLSLTMAGFLVGVLLGESILPAATVPVLLFAATGIVLLIVGVVLGSMIVGATKKPRERRNETSSRRDIVVSTRGQRSITRHPRTI